MAEQKVVRPSKEQYAAAMAKVAATRSTCLRRQVGCVVVKDGSIIATGYNGAPSGVAHCDVTGCIRETLNIPSGKNHELCYGAHAETNAIAQAAKNGISLKDGTLYCTLIPCSMCAKSIIGAGISKVVYLDGNYNDPLTTSMFTQAGIKVSHYDEKNDRLTAW
jgi:dCMP deaminase